MLENMLWSENILFDFNYFKYISTFFMTQFILVDVPLKKNTDSAVYDCNVLKYYVMLVDSVV